MIKNRKQSLLWLAHCVFVVSSVGFALTNIWSVPASFAQELRVGAASVDLAADDSMVIAGGILPGKAMGQEGSLRVTATVIEAKGTGKIAIVAADVLFVTKDFVDAALAEIERTCGIAPSHILVNSTHTHHAPSTAAVHGYDRDEVFCDRVRAGIVAAVQQANAQIDRQPCTFQFCLGEESSYGQNSRLLLADQSIYWVGPREDTVRPTGPFDPQLPVLAFKGAGNRWISVLFNHSTHTIGTRTPGVRSPSAYGLAAQELEAELGGSFLFLEGASGSTHNLNLPCQEGILRIKNSIRESMHRLEDMPVQQVASIKQDFHFKVRNFDEAIEDKKVSDYCKKRAPQQADAFIEVFRNQRAKLNSHQGEERVTQLQAMLIGEVAIVGVPAEYFTVLGMEIKRRSPFRYTFVAELANDWIGYLPDRRGHELGGYQTWMGLHSFAEPGTGERIVDDSIKMLRALHDRVSK